MPQSALTYLKLTIETLEESVEYIQDNIFVQRKLYYESGVSPVKKPMNTQPWSENPIRQLILRLHVIYLES